VVSVRGLFGSSAALELRIPLMKIEASSEGDLDVEEAPGRRILICSKVGNSARGTNLSVRAEDA
jgi:hypothetical protein